MSKAVELFDGYRHLIDLSSTPLAPVASTNPSLTAFAALYKEYHADSDEGDITLEELSAVPPYQRDQIIRSLLTHRDPTRGLPSPEILSAIDQHKQLLSERSAEPLVDVGTVKSVKEELFPQLLDPTPKVLDRIAYWRGDMTRLKSEKLAIVNPANTRMLGCFQPSHLCADNVIHHAAGPRLRQDCYTVLESLPSAYLTTRQGVKNVQVSDPLLTRGWSLPSGYVLHVAGPQISKDEDGEAKVSLDEEEQLARAYSNCLDLAEYSELIDTVAFPCISTGIFGFPAELASSIALKTVVDWLDARPNISLRVIFVLFSPADTKHYLTALSQLFPQLPEPLRLEKHIVLPARGIEWVRDCDSILIHAGAGLSADAHNSEIGFGLDYNSKELFKKLYPGLLKSTEMRTLYHSIGYQFDDPLVKWAYFLRHAHTVSTWGLTPIYTTLLSLAQSKSSYSILTSNADMLFAQSGFDSSRIWTPQGSYGNLQCLANCTPTSYEPTRPWVDAALPFIDPETMRLPEDRPDLIPRCQKCGGDVFLNVRGGDWFNETPMEGQQERYRAQVVEAVSKAKVKGSFVTILEIGAGFNTPGVVRFPGENLVKQYGGLVKLVRVNMAHPEVPQGGNFVGVKAGAVDFFRAFDSAR